MAETAEATKEKLKCDATAEQESSVSEEANGERRSSARNRDGAAFTAHETRIDSDAFAEELKGKTLGEQVKFLKERGFTFRLISERLNVPMTNCYTAIKKLRLPKEYWERIKAEVRMKKKALDVAEDMRVAEMFANIPSMQRRAKTGQELTDNSNTDIEMTSANGNDSTITFEANRLRKEGPLCGARKHLTLDDGKVVQHWREQGLTLQKIANKLRIPMSSCYRALKRYQVSQKTHLLLQNERNASAPPCSLDVRKDCSSGTADVLLGMVDPTKRVRWSPIGGDALEIMNGVPLSYQNSEEFRAQSSERHYNHKRRLLSWNEAREGNVAMDARDGCLAVSDGTLSRKADLGTSTLLCGSRSSLPAESPVGASSREEDLAKLSDSLDTDELALTVKAKLRWAAALMSSSTDPEQILNLMKVMSSGLFILKQFAQSP